MPTDTAAVAAVLERAAELIDGSPGMNALDAQREAILERTNGKGRARQAVIDQLAGDTYYALLDYLPPHVDQIGRWSDAETPDRVAAKLRQLARTLRKGGPAHVDGPPPLADPSDVALTERAGHAGRPAPGRAERKAARRNFTPDGRLRLQLSTARRWLAVQQRKAHPDAHKVTELELRIAEIERELAALDGEEAEAEGDAAALALIEESRAFPADRVPVLAGAGYQRNGASMSGL